MDRHSRQRVRGEPPGRNDNENGATLNAPRYTREIATRSMIIQHGDPAMLFPYQ
jgi:hypothetical protein